MGFERAENNSLQAKGQEKSEAHSLAGQAHKLLSEPSNAGNHGRDSLPAKTQDLVEKGHLGSLTISGADKHESTHHAGRPEQNSSTNPSSPEKPGNQKPENNNHKPENNQKPGNEGLTVELPNKSQGQKHDGTTHGAGSNELTVDTSPNQHAAPEQHPSHQNADHPSAKPDQNKPANSDAHSTPHEHPHHGTNDGNVAHPEAHASKHEQPHHETNDQHSDAHPAPQVGKPPSQHHETEHNGGSHAEQQNLNNTAQHADAAHHEAAAAKGKAVDLSQKPEPQPNGTHGIHISGHE